MRGGGFAAKYPVASINNMENRKQIHSAGKIRNARFLKNCFVSFDL